MSYFNARTGPRPAKGNEQDQREVGTGQQRADQMPRPAFAAQTGARPLQPDRPLERGVSGAPLSSHDTCSAVPMPPSCPLCRGALACDEGGLYRCQGRCGARWLETSPGHLVDLATLPLGICACCKPPQALVKGNQGAVCPNTGRVYLLLPDGTALPADTASEGLCRCCVPPMPLVRREGRLVCAARPDHVYERRGDQVLLVAAPGNTPGQIPTETLAEIDAALRRNSARVTINGLFDVG